MPELAQVEHISAEMVPLSGAELASNQSTNDWNSGIGAAAGKLLHSVTTGTSEQSEEEKNSQSVLTDPAYSQPHRDMMEAHREMQAEAEDSWSDGGYNTAGGS